MKDVDWETETLRIGRRSASGRAQNPTSAVRSRVSCSPERCLCQLPFAMTKHSFLCSSHPPTPLALLRWSPLPFPTPIRQKHPQVGYRVLCRINSCELWGANLSFSALVHVRVGPRMVCARAHREAPLGVQDDDVCIRSLEDCSFARVYVEDLGTEKIRE